MNGKFVVDIEAKGEPSRWVTLRALRVLKAAGRLAVLHHEVVDLSLPSGVSPSRPPCGR